MAVPSSIKIKKDNVEFLNNCDRANYTIRELTRAAMKDVGKFVAKRTRQQIRKRTGRLAKNIQYWVRKIDQDVQIGFKPGGFYGGFQELGTVKQPKIAALYNSVKDNIGTIRDIEAQYLSAIEDEQKALALIDEKEEMGDGE